MPKPLIILTLIALALAPFARPLIIIPTDERVIPSYQVVRPPRYCFRAALEYHGELYASPEGYRWYFERDGDKCKLFKYPAGV